MGYADLDVAPSQIERRYSLTEKWASLISLTWAGSPWVQWPLRVVKVIRLEQMRRISVGSSRRFNGSNSRNWPAAVVGTIAIASATSSSCKGRSENAIQSRAFLASISCSVSMFRIIRSYVSPRVRGKAPRTSIRAPRVRHLLRASS